MTVSSVNAASNYVSQVQPQPQSSVERVAEKEKTNEEAKKVAATVNAPVPPTVNTNGQTVGAIISVKA